ncbi:MAG: DUF5125 domain-containing protein [Bacteroidales bacterium]
MNKYIYLAIAGLVGLSSCNEDDLKVGNPLIDIRSEITAAYMGDSLQFTVNASDDQVALSTLKAELFLGEEKVSQTVIRTKVSGDNYSGKIYVPYLQNIPNGKATLKYTLQNINFTTSEKETQIEVSRPDYPYLTLVTEAGDELPMERESLYQYSITQNFPQEIKGYIKTPESTEFGKQISFGWRGGKIEQGSSSLITFSSISAGNYAIEFNTLSYEAAPFVQVMVNGVKFQELDADYIFADLSLSQGESVVFEGIAGFENWSLDPDFFNVSQSGEISFAPIAGSYRILANNRLQSIIVLTLNNGAPATLQSNGTGAIWVIGDGVGKPTVATNEVGWTTEKGLCMAQLESKKFQITLVAGSSVKADNINFKFFHQQGWGGEFSGTTLTSTSDIVGVGDGVIGDNGNLYIKEGQSLIEGHTYKFTIDVSAGNSSAVLSVIDQGVK